MTFNMYTAIQILPDLHKPFRNFFGRVFQNVSTEMLSPRRCIEHSCPCCTVFNLVFLSRPWLDICIIWYNTDLSRTLHFILSCTYQILNADFYCVSTEVVVILFLVDFPDRKVFLAMWKDIPATKEVQSHFHCNIGSGMYQVISILSFPNILFATIFAI